MEHSGSPEIKPVVHFDLDMCGKCHPDQYKSYIYGDNIKTKFGGSPERYDKNKDFAHYNDIVDGHGFTKEYNARRSHNMMLLDHFDIKRGKFDTCLQCKSTKAAYYWNSGKEITVGEDVAVKAGHMKDEIIVPKGTKVRMSTAFDAPYPNTHEVQVLVTLPDGKTYSSYDYAGATKDPNWTWSAIYAITVDGLAKDSPTRLSGNGCNECHDPHKSGHAKGGTKGFRVVRKAELLAIEKRGLNPYKKDSAKTLDAGKALTVDGSVALCAQCHVEYVCGVSSIDKIDRDYFPWRKVKDLEADNEKTFPGYGAYTSMKHVQDWKHGAGPLSSPNSPANNIKYNTPHAIGEPLTKSQHPEAETYWNSPHYGYNAKCYTCHMPKVTKAKGGSFTSHWMASPYKYMSKEAAGPFAKKLGLKLNKSGGIDSCGGCHTGKVAAKKMANAKKVQDGIYAAALKVQDALVASLASIQAAKAAKAAGKTVDAKLLNDAIEDHRQAHVRWENLAVSENSMGFHNPPEVKAEMAKALVLAASAKAKADKAAK
jgi:formate-dependent nitrite reductase cytochrome c552 subunit